MSGLIFLKSTHFAKSVVLFMNSFSYNDFKLKPESEKQIGKGEKYDE